MFGRPFPNQAQRERICMLYANGGRLEDVSKETGYCVTTVTARMIGRTDAKLYPQRVKLQQLSRGGPDWEPYRNAFQLLESQNA